MVAYLVSVDRCARPQVFPLPSGGLQVEWHYAGNHVEVEIEKDGSLHLLAVDASEHVVIDAEVEDIYIDVAVLHGAQAFLNNIVASGLNVRTV